MSYNASWLHYPVTIFHWNGNPADFDVWYNDGPEYTLDYNLVLSDIPEGHQHIEFTAVAIGRYIGVPYFSSFTKESTVTLDFAVTNPTTKPAVRESSVYDNLVIAGSLITVIIVVVALVIYFKKPLQKSLYRKSLKIYVLKK